MTDPRPPARIQAAIEGSDEAIADLVRAYRDRVYRFGLHACPDPFDADDVVQEAFMKLARRPDVQRHGGALSWLMTTVRHACLRLLRRLVRRRGSLADQAAVESIGEPAASPDVMLERWRLVQLVHQAIAKLPRTYREVLILRDLEGFSARAVCAALDCGGGGHEEPLAPGPGQRPGRAARGGSARHRRREPQLRPRPPHRSSIGSPGRMVPPVSTRA